MSLLNNYLSAEKSLAEIHTTETASNEALQKTIRNIKNDYYDQIRTLEQERDRKIDDEQEAYDTNITRLKSEVPILNATIKEVKNIFSMMTIAIDGFTVEAPKLYEYSNRDASGNYINPSRKVYFNPIQSIREDDYSNIQLYIVPNKKPTNKYSLILAGNFPLFRCEPGRNFRFYGYGTPAHDEGCDIKLILKEAPSEETLTEYVTKNLKKILEKVPNKELDEYIQTYETARVYLQNDTWKIAYYEDQKYYYENHYSHGTDTPEYKNILKTLKNLQQKSKKHD
jgi:hypothetical protein